MDSLINNASSFVDKVKTGGCLHHVEHITCDTSSGVYWKGQLIDFIKDPNKAFYREAINKLATLCEHLELINVPINIETVVHFSGWFSAMPNDYKYKKLLMLCPDIRVSGGSKIIFIKSNHVAEFSNSQWCFYNRDADQSITEWSYLWGQQALISKGYESLSLSYSNLDRVNAYLEHFDVPVNLLY